MSLAALDSLCIVFRTLQVVLQKFSNADAADGWLALVDHVACWSVRQHSLLPIAACFGLRASVSLPRPL